MILTQEIVSAGEPVSRRTYPAMVLKRREIVMCPHSAKHWHMDERALCAEGNDHAHQHFEVHVHRDLVQLPDGTSITAVSFDADDPYARATATDFGLYFDAVWMPPWPHEHVSWPDFGVPTDSRAFIDALQELQRRARLGQVVELGCLGGHGRTGTALGCLAALTGQSSREAVAWVRANYCVQAVENREQEEFVQSFTGAD